MKKIIAILTAMMLTASMAACGSSDAKDTADASAKEETTAEETKDDSEVEETTDDAEEATDGKVYNVGICQLVQHEALDAATQGFMDALVDELGEDKV